MKLFMILLAAFLLAGCSASQQASTNTTASPSPSPTINMARNTGERDAAVKSFLNAKYPGWEIVGTDTSAGCQDGVICAIQLARKTETKVISVIARVFHKPDGAAYWFVYEATSLDIVSARVSLLLEQEHE